jgi:hypothetical protein
MRKLTEIFLIALLALPAFAQDPDLIINGQGTATITWSPPTEYTNGSPLPPADITGFVIFYHDASRFEADGTTLRSGCTASPESSRIDNSCYANTVDLTDGSSQSQQLTFQLDQDVTLYFAMTAYVRSGNTFGDWSTYSSEVSKSFTLEVTDGRPPQSPQIQSIDMTITCTTNQQLVTCTFNVQ